jgi:hypothetical protein
MLHGLAGIVKETSYIESANDWIATKASTWGWIHLVGGSGLAAGFGILSGAAWAQWLWIFTATISVLVNLRFLPFEPWLTLTIMFMDLRVVHLADCPTLPSMQAGEPICVLVVTLAQTKAYRNDHG